ncbi:MAG TPA: NAD-dependent epimerase/dehydratase family protein, partial [Nannocystis sp.]
MSRILITGSHGLVGAAMKSLLTNAGHLVRCLDLRAPQGDGRGDVLDRRAVEAAVAACDGILHFAAVSRVIWGERDPALCRATNEGGTRNVLHAALASPRRPWIVFASSREVYGEPDALPVREDAPLRPVNVYGETKIVGERLIEEARGAGLATAIVRLSNVYGSVHDHADRVVPAFASRALAGEPLRIDGADHTFDFTHIDDTARGIAAVIDALEAGERRLPAIHLLTGVPTTLGELASAAVDLAASASPLVHAPPRSYDVARFYGEPSRARA